MSSSLPLAPLVRNIFVMPTVAGLRSRPGQLVTQYCFVQEIGRFFVWINGSTAADDGFNAIVPTDSGGFLGAWQAIFIYASPANPEAAAYVSWFVDPLNVSGNASDGNPAPGTLTAPLASFAHMSAVIGAAPVGSSTVYLMSSSPTTDHFTPGGGNLIGDVTCVNVSGIYGMTSLWSSSGATAVQSAQPTFAIVAATNATPIVCTFSSAAYTPVSGDRVNIEGGTGNTHVNGVNWITVLSPTTFALYSDQARTVGVAGNGTYGASSATAYWSNVPWAITDTSIPGTWSNSGPSTTIALGSNGATLPQATIYVASTVGFPVPGSFSVGGATVYYSGKTAGAFTGCTSVGTPTLATGNTITSSLISFMLYWPSTGACAWAVKDLGGKSLRISQPTIPFTSLPTTASPSPEAVTNTTVTTGVPYQVVALPTIGSLIVASDVDTNAKDGLGGQRVNYAFVATPGQNTPYANTSQIPGNNVYAVQWWCCDVGGISGCTALFGCLIGNNSTWAGGGGPQQGGAVGYSGGAPIASCAVIGDWWLLPGSSTIITNTIVQSTSVYGGSGNGVGVLAGASVILNNVGIFDSTSAGLAIQPGGFVRATSIWGASNAVYGLYVAGPGGTFSVIAGSLPLSSMITGGTSDTLVGGNQKTWISLDNGFVAANGASVQKEL